MPYQVSGTLHPGPPVIIPGTPPVSIRALSDSDKKFPVLLNIVDNLEQQILPGHSCSPNTLKTVNPEKHKIVHHASIVPHLCDFCSISDFIASAIAFFRLLPSVQKGAMLYTE